MTDARRYPLAWGALELRTEGGPFDDTMRLVGRISFMACYDCGKRVFDGIPHRCAPEQLNPPSDRVGCDA